MVDIDLRKQKKVAQPASKLKRFFAFVIDLLIIDFFIFSHFERFYINSKSIDTSNASFSQIMEMFISNTNQVVFYFFIGMLLATAYLVYTQFNLNQTMGMFLMKIKVASKDKELKYWQVFLRNLFMIPIGPILILWIVDPIYFLISGERLSDILSKTKVVEAGVPLI